MGHCFGDYTTNVALDLPLSEGLLDHKQRGVEIGKDHGWPLTSSGVPHSSRTLSNRGARDFDLLC